MSELVNRMEVNYDLQEEDLLNEVANRLIALETVSHDLYVALRECTGSDRSKAALEQYEIINERKM
jgi:hypothetical protein